MEMIRQALDRARRERAELLHDEGVDGRATEQSSQRAAAARPAVLALDTAIASADPTAAADSFRRAVGRHRVFEPEPAVLDRHRILEPNGTGVAAAAFRQLRTQVLQRMRERGWQTIGIASARSRDGKTTLAANLGITIAADPRHTSLLVDLDLRRPSVARLFGCVPEIGVEDVLAGEAALETCLTQLPKFPGFRLLPARAPVAGSSRVVADAPCHNMVVELRARYANRVVLFDMPPLLEADDAVTLTPMLDCVLFVVAEGQTAREDVARGLELLRKMPVVGTVLNRSVEAVRSEAYG